MKDHTSNSSLTPYARELRKNMTKEERKLWYEFFRGLPLPVHRQFVIGNYILDFYCDRTKTAIELDGSQHYEDKAQEKDRERDAFLASHGITVLRYSNYEISRNFRGVCEDIAKHFGLDI